MGPRHRAGMAAYIMHGSSVDPSKVKNFQPENDYYTQTNTHILLRRSLFSNRWSEDFKWFEIRITSATLFLVWLSHPPLGFYWLVLPLDSAFQTIETRFRIGQSKTREINMVFSFIHFTAIVLSSDDIFSWAWSISTNRNKRKTNKQTDIRTSERKMSGQILLWPIMRYVDRRNISNRWYDFDKTRHRCSARQ